MFFCGNSFSIFVQKVSVPVKPSTSHKCRPQILAFEMLNLKMLLNETHVFFVRNWVFYLRSDLRLHK